MGTFYHFIGGEHGTWSVDSLSVITGTGIAVPRYVEIVQGRDLETSFVHEWILTGFTSNARYTVADEKTRLVEKQALIGRPEATCAALIPISKSADWWEMPQDERRNILETRSHHISTGLEYLPAISRRLHHCRDIGGEFDFLTWFEFEPEHSLFFDELVGKLRDTEEWKYVDREVDIRLIKVRS